MVRKQSYCYFFCFIFLQLYSVVSSTPHLCRHDQRDALLEFKDEFPNLQYSPRASNTSLSSWNKSMDCCSWEGVTCDGKSGEVNSLYFYSIFLNNSLKEDSGLFRLTHLQNLTLSNCCLHGNIPSSIGNLSQLITLELSSNKLVGQLPPSMGNLTQLRFLVLSQNNLSGNIPMSFSNLKELVNLDISSNQFTGGNFPFILPNVTSLYRLPLGVSGLSKLENFDMHDNSLSGPLHTSLFMIPSLTWVDFSGNYLEGPIEFGNISSSSRLEYLFLANNQFKGTIPTSISNLVNLIHLDLSNNNLEGQVPGWLSQRQQVMLSQNSFNSFEKSWEVFNETNMEALDLRSNSFQGTFPYWICKLRSLRFLDVSDNLFTGSIPQCLKNSTASLTYLVLRNNSFSGILPNIFFNATQLISLDVSHNQLEGKVPKSLINCKAMQLLNMESNRFEDEFPSWLGSLPSLNIFILRSNQFYGPLYHNNRLSIGFQALKVIDLSNNHFSGSLPSFYFSNWHEMTTLTGNYDDSYMEYYVYYAAVYYNSMEMVNKGVNTEFERIRQDFRAIDFSRNNFCGSIPESIGLLKELHLLNVSGNTFTSNIPQSLKYLTKLETLDLSWNQLSGQIPGGLASLSFLSSMDFSHNNLQGPIPRSTQFQSQNCSSFMDNHKLYGLEEICRETDHAPNPTPQAYEDLFEREEERVINWIAAAIAYGPGVFCGLVIGHIFVSQKHKWLTERHLL
ncbi:unnamed protein product [Brassica rapa]|uniref:Uncharacterized protein n=1 Tax=Brassica campestris TaxID=3711 RepID=A0A3P6C4Q4_BRACM|nr:unnamed protein product [Brassica rapa]VDD02889.1 unnamed protein product [Brassica rapa]